MLGMQNGDLGLVGENYPSDAVQNQKRLAALDATGVMDSPPEEVFDRAVRLATRILGTPVGLLSFVDGERQFFKAQIGLPEPTATARQTPLTHSFCQYVVASDAPLMVRDAREDTVLKDNLAVPDLGVIAYLGVPVHAPDGDVLGSFCAIQSEPRDWTEQEREALEDIAIGIETEIALRGQLKRIAELEKQASTAEERFRLALQAGHIGTFDFDPVAQKSRWDKETYSIWGVPEDEPDVFSAIQKLIDADDLDAWRSDLAASLDPNGQGKQDTELKILSPQTRETKWLHSIGKTTFENGQAVRMVGTIRDISAQKNAEMRAQTLAEELNHRVKNLFAIVTGMISSTARSTATTQEMASALRGRVVALASAHDLIQPAITGYVADVPEITLEKLLSAVLAPHSDGVEQALRLDGPTLPLNPKIASNLALVVHELATNAAKYGALSTSNGTLAIEWEALEAAESIDGEVVRIVWTETGGPIMDKEPSTKGFGSALIRLTVNGQMGGAINTKWHKDGVCHEILLPAYHFHS